MTTTIGMNKAQSLADMDVDSALQQTVWEAQVATEKVLYSPMLQNLKSFGSDVITVDDQKSMSLPMNKCIINVAPSNKAARRVTMAFLQALASPGVYGTTTLIASEEDRRLKSCSAYANDWKHGVPADRYGITYREASPYKIHQAAKRDLAKWHGENQDYFLHAAIIEGRSPNLASAPVSLNQPLNSQCFVMGASIASQPARFSDDDGGTDMEDEVGDFLKDVTYTNCRSTVPRLLDLMKFARLTRYINPLNLPDGDGYLYFAHPDEVSYLRDASQTNSFGSQWLSGAAIQDSKQVVPGLRFKIGELYVCEDPRAATYTVAGSNCVFTGSVGYMMHGRTDNRATGTTANTHFNINILMGAEAVFYMETEAPHYEKQLDEYSQYENIAYVGADGYCRTDWNVDTNNDDTPTVQHEGSMCVFTQRA